jgi:threonine synthase
MYEEQHNDVPEFLNNRIKNQELTKIPIKYYSTNHRAPEVSFSQALLNGIAPDGGLYLPLSFPLLSREEMTGFSGKEYHEIASVILNKFLRDEIDNVQLHNLCTDAYNFEVPLEKVCDRKYILRLDQGPTASFKDFAARMMSRLMQHFLAVNDQHLTILTATSGDTGSAVANAFYRLKNIIVIILFPENEVSLMQRKQMTTLQENIKVISVDGKFDDCQRLVKRAFMDKSLSHIPLSSANSINIGRLLPQSVYYFYAWSRLAAHENEKAVFSVPSGNFGNLMGGMIAARMGLPVKQFIISTNENDEVPEYLRSGVYKSINPSRKCISSAMNVGHPSNLARIISLYGGEMDETGTILYEPDLKQMRKDLFGVSVSDEKTRLTIAEVFRKYNILLEPHGAVAWQAIRQYSRSVTQLHDGKQLFISLETAHPAKFPEELLRIINVNPPVPASLTAITGKNEYYLSAANDYERIRQLIIDNSSAA